MIFGLIYLFTGLYFILEAAIRLMKYSFNKNFIEIEGKLTKSISEYDAMTEHGYMSYTPVIEYYIDGKKFVAKTKFSYAFKHKEGNKIRLKYNPEKPDEIVLKKDNVAVLSIILGIIFVILGVFHIIKFH